MPLRLDFRQKQYIYLNIQVYILRDNKDVYKEESAPTMGAQH